MAVDDLTDFCTRSLWNRSTADEFLTKVQHRQTVDGKAFAKALIDARSALCPLSDPLPPRYLEALLASSTIAIVDVIAALITRVTNRAHQQDDNDERDLQGDLRTLQDLTGRIVAAKIPLESLSIRRCLNLTAKWLTILAKSSRRSGSQETNETSNNSGLVEGVGALLATLSTTNSGVEILSETQDDGSDGVVKTVGHAVQAALDLYPAISGTLVSRLGEIQKHIAMYSTEESTELQALQFQANVAELQVVATRAGTTALLQSLIAAGKTVDENTLFNFLAGRHANDYSSMFLDILFSSFQVLKESQAVALAQTSLYIRNRLPGILALILQSSFENFSAEQALIDSWSQLQLTPETMPCAQRFIHACSLNGIIAAEKATELIGTQELSPVLSKQLYAKDDIVGQLSGSAGNAEKLINEMLHSEGNGVVISQALIELMVAYARRKETHHLKDLAHVILRHPDSINALSLFHQARHWIGPLCTLLDEWKWDEIHSESQPMYDEFGSIFLLVITTKRRLSYTNAELRIEGFVARYLDQEGVERPISALSESSKKHFGDWVNALYIAESLSDELTASCSPQEFYMLVPTLLRQSVMAYHAGKLTEDQLKGGLEYLLEPFLLPSLVSAMVWASVNPDAGQVVKPILSRDTDNAIHKTILSMTASPRDFTLHTHNKDNLQTLKTNITSAVTGPGTGLFMEFPVVVYGGFAVVQCLIEVLLSFSGTNQFIFALDLVATLAHLADLRSHIQLRLANLGQLLKKQDRLTAEAIVHLYRRTEAYCGLLTVQDVSIDIANLPEVEQTEAAAQVENSEQPVDDIDQVLNESAAMNALDNELDATMESGMDQVGDLDSFYLQDDNMGLGNLDDLDLDMF